MSLFLEEFDELLSYFVGFHLFVIGNLVNRELLQLTTLPSTTHRYFSFLNDFVARRI